MRHIALAILLVSLACAQAAAQTAQPSPTPAASPAASTSTSSNAWQAYITPYVWLPNLNGQLNFQHPTAPTALIPGNVNVNVHIGPSSYLSNISFAGMLSGYFKSSGDFSGAFDYIYLNMNPNNAFVADVSGPAGNKEVPVNVSTSAHFRGSIVTLDGGLSITQNTISPVEFIAGVRYLAVNTSADWTFAGPLDILDRSGSASRSLNVWDPLVGFRGKIGFGKNWYVPYYLDYGAGSNNTTNQEFVGVGYSQHWGDIVLINRWMQYNFFNPNINSFQLVGPALGVRIRL